MTKITYKNGGVTGEAILYDRSQGEEFMQDKRTYPGEMSRADDGTWGNTYERKAIFGESDYKKAQDKQVKLYKLLQTKKSPFVYNIETI